MRMNASTIKEPMGEEYNLGRKEITPNKLNTQLIQIQSANCAVFIRQIP